MNRILRFICIAAAAALSANASAQHRPQRCGNGLIIQRMAAKQPGLLDEIRRAQMADIAATDLRPGRYAQKSTGQNPIQVVFHFVVTPGQLTILGGESGIRDRVATQIQRLNEDFNRSNSDSVLIPADFKDRYGNAGIRFIVAKGTSGKTIAPGIELLKVNVNNRYDVDSSCAAAKRADTSGLAAWNVRRYMNVWICNITDGSGNGNGQILGITVPWSLVGRTDYNGHTYRAGEVGIAVSFGAIGVRTSPSQNFFSNFDLGRTLTHETGHFFELSHIWGDDEGRCPDNGGHDDGFADTPPQADYTDCFNGCPTFPKLDFCSPAAPGVMFMDFMDYTDDRAMQMFTTGQAAYMHSQIDGGKESYSLTQNTDSGAIPVLVFSISPNPATSTVHVVLDDGTDLQSIELFNLLGQRIMHVGGSGESIYDLPVGHLERGLYILQCRTDVSIQTQKIILR